jgi:hypothetical protein
MKTRSSLVFLIYLAITIALTYPLITMLGRVLPHDSGDPALNTWILWWNAHAIPYTAKWWNAPAFYPAPGSLAFSENLLGLSLISSPVQWLGGGPQLAYNVVFLLTFPLCALGAYLLVRELTWRDDAAFIGGLLFGFAPYRMAQAPHIQCLAAFGMPFALLGLHRYLRDTRSRWLVLFGAGWFLQAICNGYYMLFFGVVVGLWIFWFATPIGRSRSIEPRATWRTFGAIVLAWMAASLPLVPLLRQYRNIHETFGFTRNFATIRDFGADIAALLDTSPLLSVWGWMHAYHRAEGELFPGLTIAVLIVAGMFVGDRSTNEKAPRVKDTVRLVRWGLMFVAVITAAIALSASEIGSWRFRVFGLQIFSVTNPIKPLTYSLVLAIGLAITAPRLRRSFSTRAAVGFYSLAAFLTWLFSLGPAPSLMGKPLMYRGPYSLLMLLPGFNALRVPARFWMMTTLCLAVVGGLLFHRLASRLRSGRTVAAAIVACCVLADGWVTSFPFAQMPPAWKVESCARVAGPQGPSLGRQEPLMELPLGYFLDDVAAMYRAMAHRHPLVNGYSGYFPPHYAALSFGLKSREPEMLTQLAAHGVRDVVVDEAADPDGSWRGYLASHPGVETVCSEERRTLYRLPDAPAWNTKVEGTPLHIGSIRANIFDGDAKYMVDGDPTTRWQSDPQTAGTQLDLDLGDTKSVTGIQLMLGPYVADFPRALSIEALDKSAVWQDIYRGGTATLAFVAAFEAPRDMPLTFRFAPVQTRYLRLRLEANDDIYCWSVAELKVFGS